MSNGATEAVNNLLKRVKRAAFGFTSFRNRRIRTLLYAGKPNWEFLPTITYTGDWWFRRTGHRHDRSLPWRALTAPGGHTSGRNKGTQDLGIRK